LILIHFQPLFASQSEGLFIVALIANQPHTRNITLISDI